MRRPVAMVPETNKRTGAVVCDDGAVFDINTDISPLVWVEIAPIPGTQRAEDLVTGVARLGDGT